MQQAIQASCGPHVGGPWRGWTGKLPAGHSGTRGTRGRPVSHRVDQAALHGTTKDCELVCFAYAGTIDAFSCTRALSGRSWQRNEAPPAVQPDQQALECICRQPIVRGVPARPCHCTLRCQRRIAMCGQLGAWRRRRCRCRVCCTGAQPRHWFRCARCVRHAGVTASRVRLPHAGA